MKRQFVQFGVVIVVLVLFIGGYFGISKYIADKEEKEKEEIIVAFKLENADKISAFSYIYSGSVISLKKTDTKWNCVDDTSVKISESEIETMLEQLVCIEAFQKIEKPENLSDYGFTTNEEGSVSASINTIVVSEDEKNTDTIYIGDANPYNPTQYYLMVEGDDTIYVISDTIVEAFSKAVEDITEEETTVEETDTEEDISVEETTMDSSETEKN